MDKLVKSVSMEAKQMSHHCYNGTYCCKHIHLPLLTDKYQITMAYAYWKHGKHNVFSVFDLFFRKNPFGGEFTIFAGLDDCIKFLQGFHYTKDDISFIRKILPEYVEQEFYDYLSAVTAKQITLYAVSEGSAVFPKEPLMRVEGPLIIVQLLETTLLNLVNYASLIATNSTRYRIALHGRDIKLFEFGLRRAQGPDGGLTASKYAHIGGFDGTSNLLAAKLYGIPAKGTHAHSYIMSYSSTCELQTRHLLNKNSGESIDFAELCLKYKQELSTLLNVIYSEASNTEFLAFIAYALAFPDSFLALLDTYDVLRSGILNFCAVALALNDLGYRAMGVRIDSGDLAYQSKIAYNSFCLIQDKYKLDWFSKLLIVASNDINEDTIVSLNEQTHKINCFGIGTHLVTCERQPALGCVYKLVEIENHACIKLSLDIEKVTIPGRKNVYRLYGKEGFALLDLMQGCEESPPQVNSKILCRHPFQESKRCHVIPSKVEPLLKIWWKDGQIQRKLPELEEIRNHVQESISLLRSDIKRYLNPTPYKISISDDLYQYMHRLWLDSAPIGELT